MVPRNLSILHAEDDENDLLLFMHAFSLEQVSNPVQVVRDGEQALAYLAGEGAFGDRAQHPIPGLVILDLKMPKVTGFEVLKWVRAHRDLKALPVLFLTNSFLPEDVARAYQLGVNCFITKPFDFGELREIARFLKVWVRHAMLPPTDERDWVALTAHDLEQTRQRFDRRAA